MLVFALFEPRDGDGAAPDAVRRLGASYVGGGLPAARDRRSIEELRHLRAAADQDPAHRTHVRAGDPQHLERHQRLVLVRSEDARADLRRHVHARLTPYSRRLNGVA